MSSKKPDERRKFERVKANFVVVYAVDEPLQISITIDDEADNALILDLSQGGLAIKTERDIKVGTKLLINFIIVDKANLSTDSKVKAMNIKGMVCNNKSIDKYNYRLGISFTEISDEDKKFINDFVKNR